MFQCSIPLDVCPNESAGIDLVLASLPLGVAAAAFAPHTAHTARAVILHSNHVLSLARQDYHAEIDLSQSFEEILLSVRLSEVWMKMRNNTQTKLRIMKRRLVVDIQCNYPYFIVSSMTNLHITLRIYFQGPFLRILSNTLLHLTKTIRK